MSMASCIAACQAANRVTAPTFSGVGSYQWSREGATLPTGLVTRVPTLASLVTEQGHYPESLSDLIAGIRGKFAPASLLE